MTQIEAKCPECGKLAWELTISREPKRVPVTDPGKWNGFDEFEPGPVVDVAFKGTGPDGEPHSLSLSFRAEGATISRGQR